MNLQEFLNYRSACPLCDKSLSIFFRSNRKQQHFIKYDKHIFQFNLPNTQMFPSLNDVKVRFIVDPTDNTFQLTYVHGIDNQHIDPTADIKDRFESFNKNLKSSRFWVVCKNCNNYMYRSNVFLPDIECLSIIPLIIEYEDFNISYSVNDGYKTLKIINEYGDYNKSWVNINAADQSITNQYVSAYNEKILLPLIKFTNKISFLDKINTALVFR